MTATGGLRRGLDFGTRLFALSAIVPSLGLGGSSQADPPAPAGPSYPATRRGDDADTLFGVRVDDPYRWLEDASRPEVQDWMRAQDGLTRDWMTQLPGRVALEARLKELLYFDWASTPEHEGNRWFVERRPKSNEKSSVYVRDSWRGKERVLFDPEAMSPDGSVSLHGFWPSRDARYVAYKVSKNNADMATVLVRDLAGGNDLPDRIDGGRYAAPSWSPDNRGFYYTSVPTDPKIPLAEIPAHKQIRYHHLGEDAARDQLILEEQADQQLFPQAEVTRDGHWLVIHISHGWSGSEVWFRDLRKQLIKRDADPSPLARAGFTKLAGDAETKGTVFEWKDRFYYVTNDGAPNWRVYRIDPDRLDRASWKEIVPERKDAALDDLQIVGGRLLLRYLVDVHSVLEIHDLDGRMIKSVALPGLGTTSSLTGRPDEEFAYFEFQSFVTPPQIHRLSMKSGKIELIEAVKVPADLGKLQVDQQFYDSKDGTPVPMFVVHAKDWKHDGNNPVYLTGYGGFSSSWPPYFSSSILLWLEHGGVYVVPNLRGGAEYGEAWHRGGMREKKQNVFDDFIGAAEWLIREKVTKPSRIAIEGASNGGLLVGAAMTQRPELFGAVVCGVPLLDMIRYTKFGSGATWAGEYGDPAEEQPFRWLYAYSPYHHVVAGTRYPPLLMLSADSDDRVDPMHARKFLAAIQYASAGTAPALLRIERNAGHTGADQTKQRVAIDTDIYGFLFKMLGMN